MSIKSLTFLKLLKHDLLNPHKKIQVLNSESPELEKSFSFPKLLLPLVTIPEALRVRTTFAACIEEGEILSNITYESVEKTLELVMASSAMEELIESNSCGGINKADIALFLKLNPKYLSEKTLRIISKELAGKGFEVIQKAPDHAALIKLAKEKQKVNINYTLTENDRKAATITKFHPTVFELLGRFITERLQKEIEESPKALEILRAENEGLKLYQNATQRAEAIFTDQAVTAEKQRAIEEFRVKFESEDYEKLEQAFKQQDKRDMPRGFALTQKDLKQLISSPNNDSSFSVSIDDAYEQIQAALAQNNKKLNILEKQTAVERVAKCVSASGVLPKQSRPIAFIKPGYTFTDKSTMRLKTFVITQGSNGKYQLQDAFTEAAVKTITDQIGFLGGTKSQKRKNMPPEQAGAVLKDIRRIFSGEA